MHVAEGFPGLCFQLISPSCKVLGVRVSCSGAECSVISLLSMSLGQMKAASDLGRTLPSGVASSVWGSTELSLDGTDDGGEYEGDLGE